MTTPTVPAVIVIEPLSQPSRLATFGSSISSWGGRVITYLRDDALPYLTSKISSATHTFVTEAKTLTSHSWKIATDNPITSLLLLALGILLGIGIQKLRERYTKTPAAIDVVVTQNDTEFRVTGTPERTLAALTAWMEGLTGRVTLTAANVVSNPLSSPQRGGGGSGSGGINSRT